MHCDRKISVPNGQRAKATSAMQVIVVKSIPGFPQARISAWWGLASCHRIFYPLTRTSDTNKNNPQGPWCVHLHDACCDNLMLAWWLAQMPRLRPIQYSSTVQAEETDISGRGTFWRLFLSNILKRIILPWVGDLKDYYLINYKDMEIRKHARQCKIYI